MCRPICEMFLEDNLFSSLLFTFQSSIMAFFLVNGTPSPSPSPRPPVPMHPHKSPHFLYLPILIRGLILQTYLQTTIALPFWRRILTLYAKLFKVMNLKMNLEIPTRGFKQIKDTHTNTIFSQGVSKFGMDLTLSELACRG